MLFEFVLHISLKLFRFCPLAYDLGIDEEGKQYGGNGVKDNGGGAEGKDHTILRDYLSEIVMDLEPNNILPHLARVLTQNDDVEIKAQSTRQRRCEKLLEILPRKGPNAFKVFVEL